MEHKLLYPSDVVSVGLWDWQCHIDRAPHRSESDDPARSRSVEQIALAIKRRRAVENKRRREAWIEELQRRREH